MCGRLFFQPLCADVMTCVVGAACVAVWTWSVSSTLWRVVGRRRLLPLPRRQQGRLVVVLLVLVLVRTLQGVPWGLVSHSKSVRQLAIVDEFLWG